MQWFGFFDYVKSQLVRFFSFMGQSAKLFTHNIHKKALRVVCLTLAILMLSTSLQAEVLFWEYENNVARAQAQEELDEIQENGEPNVERLEPSQLEDQKLDDRLPSPIKEEAQADFEDAPSNISDPVEPNPNSNKEIEDLLFISYNTVKNHIYNLYRKLGIKSRHELWHFVTRHQNSKEAARSQAGNDR